MRNIEALRDEIPPAPEIKQYLQDFFKTDKAPRHLTDINRVVADFFGISEEAFSLTLEEAGMPGHAKSSDQTALDSRVGCIVCFDLYPNDIVKRVGPNTFEGMSGPDKEMTDSPGLRAARTRAGVSEVMVSVKILKNTEQYKNDDEGIAKALSTKWAPKLVALAIKNVNDNLTP